MRRMLWGAGALVVVVAVTVGAWLLWGPSPNRTAEDCATAHGMWDRYDDAKQEWEDLDAQSGSDVAADYDGLLAVLQQDAERITTPAIRQNADETVAEHRVLRQVWQRQVDGASQADTVRDFTASAGTLKDLRDDLDGLCA